MPLILFLVWLFLKVPAIMRSILPRKNQRLQKHEWLGLFLGDLSDSVLVFSSSFLLPVSNRAKWEKFVPNRLISKHPFNNASVKIFNSFQKAHFLLISSTCVETPHFAPSLNYQILCKFSGGGHFSKTPWMSLSGSVSNQLHFDFPRWALFALFSLSASQMAA